MPKVTNITTGPKGAYLKGVFVEAAPGETIEADDYPEEWFTLGEGKEEGPAPPASEPASAAEIVAAIDLLEANNDNHWTQAGLPAVEAVAELAGKTVTRAAISDAAPDATRPAPPASE